MSKNQVAQFGRVYFVAETLKRNYTFNQGNVEPKSHDYYDIKTPYKVLDKDNTVINITMSHINNLGSQSSVQLH